MQSKPKLIKNPEIIKELKEVVAAMEVKEVNRFRIRAYQNAIVSIEALTQNVFDLWEKNKLDNVEGLGAALTQHLEDLFTKGDVKDFDLIKKDLPEGMFELIGIRGIGAKKAFKLSKAFSLNKRKDAIKKLTEAAKAGDIAQLPGFGDKSQQDILNAISEMKMHKSEKPRMLLFVAEQIASRVVDFLEQSDYIDEAVVLGSFRRRETTVGDLDIALVITEDDNAGEEAVKHFLTFDEIEDVLSSGLKKASVVLKNDVQIDVRVTKREEKGSMYQHFTGSKAHNISLRTFSLEKGMSLSEYGIKHKGNKVKFASEKEFYNYIGLDYVPPVLRQGRDEVSLASKKMLPELVRLTDIRGDIHTHTTFSDGVNTLEEMVTEAISLGYSYIGISDHAPSVQSRGEGPVKSIISTRKRNIEQFNGSQDQIRVLFGYEINILNDSSISLPDEMCKMLDYSIGSIHTSFKLPQEEQTKRIISAIRHPHIHVIGHPSGRLINERPPIDLDWEEIFNELEKHNKVLEINAQPTRLDLAEDLVYEARLRKIKMVINTDAHATDHLSLMPYGIDVAQRGWCLAEDIINTLSTKDFLKTLV
jgi:DNA polymerase (family 10)